MRGRFIRLLACVLVLAFAMSSLSASAYTYYRNNSFTLYNDTDESIVEIYIYPSSRGRGQPRTYAWIHSGYSAVINLTDADLTSRAKFSMSAGFKNGFLFSGLVRCPTAPVVFTSIAYSDPPSTSFQRVTKFVPFSSMIVIVFVADASRWASAPTFTRAPAANAPLGNERFSAPSS